MAGQVGRVAQVVDRPPRAFGGIDGDEHRTDRRGPGDEDGTRGVGDDLGIEASADLKQRLAAHLQEPAVALDGGDVRRVHTASLQVLCAFFRSRGELGHHTELAPCSEALRDAARLLGLSAPLGLANEQHASKQPVEISA